MAFNVWGLLNSGGPLTPGKVLEVDDVQDVSSISTEYFPVESSPQNYAPGQQNAAHAQQVQQSYNNQQNSFLGSLGGGLQGALGGSGGFGNNIGFGYSTQLTPSETPVAKQPEPVVESSKLVDNRSRKIRE